ncbi:MAG: AAA family ATPase [Pyrinomonadaceae bacterium]
MDGSIGTGTIKKVNECFGGRDWCGWRQPLFDEFWRRGELALLIGPAGAGKSLFAVQIADALARGREMDGFMTPYWRQKVLYVDLMLSDEQFAGRYSYFTEKKRIAKRYKFAERFYRGRPNDPEELCEWLEAAVRENGFDVVIIDDLSAVKRTHDGIRETLKVMRRLKKLCSETGAAIMAIAACDEPRPGRLVSENDMGRSRILCTVAESVIALGPDGSGHQRLVQLRSRHAKIFWTARNAPAGFVEQLESGLLGFRFDKRFDPCFDNATRTLIKRAHGLRARGMTFRAIAAELGISKTRAFDLNGKWVPAMGECDETAECEVRSAECGVDVQTNSPPYEGGVDARVLGEQTGWLSSPTAECGVQTAECGVQTAESGVDVQASSPPYEGGVDTRVLEEQTGRLSSPTAECEVQTAEPPTADCGVQTAEFKLSSEINTTLSEPEPDQIISTSTIPHSAVRTPHLKHGPKRVSIYDMERRIDRGGNEIFVESIEEHTNKPRVWYKRDRRGNTFKLVRNGLGNTVSHLGQSAFL